MEHALEADSHLLRVAPAEALHWMIEPTSGNPADGANIVAAWYGLPPKTSIVTATVDATTVGWQRVRGGAAVLTVPVDLGSDFVLTALDSSGTMIDFGRDDTGELILGESVRQPHFRRHRGIGTVPDAARTGGGAGPTR